MLEWIVLTVLSVIGLLAGIMNYRIALDACMHIKGILNRRGNDGREGYHKKEQDEDSGVESASTTMTDLMEKRRLLSSGGFCCDSDCLFG